MTTNRYGDLFDKFRQSQTGTEKYEQNESKYGDIMEFSLPSSNDRYGGLLDKCKPTRGYDTLLHQELVKKKLTDLFESEDTELSGFIHWTLKLQEMIKDCQETDTKESRQFAKELANSFENVARHRLLDCYFVYYKLGEQMKTRIIIFVFGSMDECEDFIKRTPGKCLGIKGFSEFTRFFNDGWKNIDNYHFDGQTLYFYVN